MFFTDFWKNSVIYAMNVLFSVPGIVLCYFHPCRDIVTAESPSLIFPNIYLNYLFSAFRLVFAPQMLNLWNRFFLADFHENGTEELPLGNVFAHFYMRYCLAREPHFIHRWLIIHIFWKCFKSSITKNMKITLSKIFSVKHVFKDMI